MKKPSATKKTTVLEVFTIEQPTELVEERDKQGKVVKTWWRTKLYHFTTSDRPVNHNGIQYIPLSYFDQVKWDDIVESSQENK
jgi:hypothetical protein